MRKRKTVPESFSDLSKAEIGAVLPLLMQLKYYGHDYDKVIQIFKAVLRALKVSFSDNNIVILNFLEKMLWLINAKVRSKPFLFVTVNRKKYYLPAENFADTSGLELAMANIYYLKLATIREPERPTPSTDNGAVSVSQTKYLNLLLATICRTSTSSTSRASVTDLFTKNGKKVIRDDFDSEICEEAAEGFDEMDLGEAYAVLQYWESMNADFMQAYKQVFSNDDDDSPGLFEGGEGWIAVLEDIAKDGVHGDFERVCGTNAHTLWMYLKHQRVMAVASALRQAQ